MGARALENHENHIFSNFSNTRGLPKKTFPGVVIDPQRNIFQLVRKNQSTAKMFFSYEVSIRMILTLRGQ